LYSSLDIVWVIKLEKLSWSGHAAQRGNTKYITLKKLGSRVGRDLQLLERGTNLYNILGGTPHAKIQPYIGGQY
jgi:hypothetical protein